MRKYLKIPMSYGGDGETTLAYLAQTWALLPESFSSYDIADAQVIIIEEDEDDRPSAGDSTASHS